MSKQNPIMKKIIIYIVFFALIYSIGSIYVINNQHRYVYYPDVSNFSNCLYFDEDEIKEHKGTRFYHKDSSEKLIIFYHGNAATACKSAFLMDYLKDPELSWIFVEYAGYADDPKTPSKELLEKDVRNIDEYINYQDYDTLILSGQSLGTSLAAYHSTINKPDKMFLISPFSNIEDIIKAKMLQMYIFIPFLKEDYDTENLLKNYDNELLIIHGTDDNIIPSTLSEDLAPNSKRVRIEIEKAEHNDIYSFTKTQESLIQFIK